jgi:hypothetical protein
MTSDAGNWEDKLHIMLARHSRRATGGLGRGGHGELFRGSGEILQLERS